MLRLPTAYCLPSDFCLLTPVFPLVTCPASAARSSLFFRPNSRRPQFRLLRQSYRESGALLLWGTHLDLPPMLLDNPESDGQSQTNTFALRLGGEERFKDMRQNVFRNPHAVIADHDPCLAMLCIVSSFYTQPPTVRHGLDGVHQQGEKDLLNLARVTVNGRHLGVKMAFHIHLLQIALVPHQKQAPFHDTGQIVLLRVERRLTGEREQVLDDGSTTPTFPFNLL